LITGATGFIGSHLSERLLDNGLIVVDVDEPTGDGRPDEAAFTFAVLLEDPSLRWLQYKDGSFIPFSPPAIGKTVVLKSEKLPWK
jgi:nucleoside-diphosphate-sugar epimerase